MSRVFVHGLAIISGPERFITHGRFIILSPVSLAGRIPALMYI